MCQKYSMQFGPINSLNAINGPMGLLYSMGQIQVGPLYR